MLYSSTLGYPGLHTPKVIRKSFKKRFFEQKLLNSRETQYWESVAGSVIQATGTVEFEDGLRTGVLQEDSWCPYSGHATLESDMARSLRPALTQV